MVNYVVNLQLGVVWLSFPGSDDDGSPHLQLEFKCFLVDQKTGKHIPVSGRVLF